MRCRRLTGHRTLEAGPRAGGHRPARPKRIGIDQGHPGRAPGRGSAGRFLCIDETLYAERVLRAGGRGYIMKAAGPDKILQAVRQVLDGDVFVSAKVSTRIVEGVSGRRNKAATPISQLTDREFEILQLIGRGNDNHAIAKQLHLSVKTVDAHRGHIKEKLNFKNGTELICYATRWAEMQGATEQ